MLFRAVQSSVHLSLPRRDPSTLLFFARSFCCSRLAALPALAIVVWLMALVAPAHTGLFSRRFIRCRSILLRRFQAATNRLRHHRLFFLAAPIFRFCNFSGCRRG